MFIIVTEALLSSGTVPIELSIVPNAATNAVEKTTGTTKTTEQRYDLADSSATGTKTNPDPEAKGIEQ